MRAGLVLGLVALVIGFIIGILSAFPLADIIADEGAIPPINYQSAQDFSPDAVEEAAEQFLFSYKSIIEDLVSFQDDPSLERAEARRDAFIDYAGYIQQHYRSLIDLLRDRLDQLTPGSDEAE